MNVNSRIKAAAIAAVTCLTGLACACPGEEYTADAWGQIVALYNANDLEVFSTRTMQDVADQYSAALYAEPSYDNDNYLTWYAELPSTESPYNAGMISADTHSAMIAMTNFYRWMVGYDPVSGVYSQEQTSLLQKGALVRNFSWRHNVLDSDKPADMDDALWQEGAGCDHNILALDYTPIGAVTAWMSEGYDSELETWESVGHRAVLMNYKLETMAYGYCDSVAIGLGGVSNKSNDMPFTAYPSPGYMPNNLVNPLECSWSVKLNGENFEIMDGDIDNLIITITNQRTGQQWERTADEEEIIYSFGLVAFVQPDDFEDGRYTDSYNVSITGIRDINNDVEARFTYTINFFDMNDYVQTRVSSANTCRKYMVGPDMMNDDGLRCIASILPKEIEVVADNKQTFTVPVSGEWRVDTAGKRFVNSGDTSALPSRVTDPYGYLNEISIPYQEKTDICALYDTLDIIPQSVNTGGSVKLSVYRTNASSDTVHIFKLTKQGDGNYVSEMVYNSADVQTENGEVADSYEIVNASPEDSGKYISIYYDQAWLSDRYTTPIHVSNNIAELNIETVEFDVNGDGNIDLRDLVLMNRIVNGLSECRASADCNGDGRVNVFDLIVLKEYIRESLQ